MNTLYNIFNSFFFVYGLLLFLSYVLVAILSTLDLSFYIKKSKHFRFNTIKEYKVLPSISIIAPAYNEEASIIDNIRSLLSLEYPKVEVIVVNDGSKDNSLQKIINYYRLIEVDYAYTNTIETAKIKRIYKSTEVAYSNLIVVDKENGGKADALNVGINMSRSELFLAIDVDCIIEHDAILRMVKPFIEEEDGRKIIAAGGVVRVANSCKIKDGRIVEVNYPKNIWAKFQVLEYFRAFTLGRMAWSRINGLLIISGAFGLFDRELTLKVGGYDKTCVGEDFELVVRLRKYMHTVSKQKYKVAFIPDPLCWTEVPSKFKVLKNQRNRWTRGSIDTVLKHKKMFLNPKYGKMGMISFPYWVVFEWLAPIIETIGVIYFILILIFGNIDVEIFLILTVFIFSFSLFFSSFAVFYETLFFNRYKGYKFLFTVIITSLAEIIIYHPLNVYFALLGNYSFFIKRDKKGWGKMTRTAFDNTK
ncbi:glycosyltransferase [Ancylomarina sp. 16SWW S1-10-2]|uniref:glycosyltransferase family 2 protein n=1 Tax=Ancylomarina sp. 16SWW S1-10-2 TaxID=2499681 RepID=UPI0012AD994D|nr:glycosyltransferase [Ancylomarina sp. 16SWW S1-10-2]MRT93181.1 glycosyltransferase family 2 protein [Ancylomarina sp. 16SWW S1-10-2]